MPNHVHWVLTVFEEEQQRESGFPWESGFPNPDTSEMQLGKPQSLESGVFNSNIEICDLGKSQSQPQSRESDFPKSDSFNLRVGNPQSSKPVYLQDILHSVKLFTARRINKNENRSGHLWEEESFETTIRNDRHFVNVFNYVIQNPLSAGFVADWHDWRGTRAFQSP